MANLNKENIITVDVKNATVKTEGSMSFYVTDVKTCNIYCQLVINESKSTLVKNYAPIENAEDFSITLRLIKPNNEPKELSFSLLNQVEAFFYVDLTDEYKDCIGTYNCELFVDCLVNGELERITTSSFSYRVNASIMNKLDNVIDNMQSNPLIETLATKEYVDNIVYVIDKAEAEEGITYEDFKNGGCTCKLNGSLYFGDLLLSFDDELVYTVKTDYSNMKKLYVYRITTVARPGGGATADYIVLDYKEGTYEAYNYMLEEIEHKVDQVKLDLMNIIDDANYAPVTYVNDSMKTVNDTTREYVNNCIEDITNNINTAGYTTESYVDDKVLALRTDFASNFAPLSYVNEKIIQINTSLMNDYATNESVSEISRTLSEFKQTASLTHQDHWGHIEWIMNDWAKIEYVNQKIAEAQLGGEGGSVDLSQYATKDYVHEYVANNGGSGGDSSSGVSYDTMTEYVGNRLESYNEDIAERRYATEEWVNDREYITQENLWDYVTYDYLNINGYATQDYVHQYVADNSGGSSSGISYDTMTEYVSERFSSHNEDISERGYATREWISDMGYVTHDNLGGYVTHDYLSDNGYATQDYVQEYVSNNSGSGSSGIDYDTMTEYVNGRFENHNETISERGYATEEWVNDRCYITSDYLDNNGYATQDYVQQYVADNSGGGDSSGGISQDDMSSYVNQRLESYDESLSNRGYINSEGLNERFSDFKSEYLPENYTSKDYVHTYVNGYVNNFLGDIESLLEEI